MSCFRIFASVYVFTQPLRTIRMWHWVNFLVEFKRFEFWVFLLRDRLKIPRLNKEPSLHYYLPITRWRIIGFIPFSRVLALWELQTASSEIWSRVAAPIFCDHVTNGKVKKLRGNSFMGKTLSRGNLRDLIKLKKKQNVHLRNKKDVLRLIFYWLIYC